MVTRSLAEQVRNHVTMEAHGAAHNKVAGGDAPL
jgi:hypothetical protein